MPRKEGVSRKEEKKRREIKRERAPGATLGPVNRLVLNSNNVGNSKHFIQSKRKPQSPWCWCAVAAGLRSPCLMGGWWAGWHHRATGSSIGAETQTNAASAAHFWSCGIRILDDLMAPCWQEFRGVALGRLATGMQLRFVFKYGAWSDTLPAICFPFMTGRMENWKKKGERTEAFECQMYVRLEK